MDRKDSELMGDAAQRLDALFSQVESTLPRCAKCSRIIYLDDRGICRDCEPKRWARRNRSAITARTIQKRPQRNGLGACQF